MSSPKAPPLSRLLNRLSLEAVGDTEWIGIAGSRSVSYGTRIFGGLVVAQSVMAAGRTIPDRQVHSVQQVFLRPGQASIPLRYCVHELFSGRTFASVRVEVWQEDDLISHAQIGLTAESDGESHADPIGDVIPRAEMVNRARHRGNTRWEDEPIEILVSAEQVASSEATLGAWLRASGSVPDEQLVHRALLAYASDRMMLGVSWKPHLATGERKSATLNHNLWFHRDVDFGQWIHHHQHSPTAGHGRGMIFGAFHQDDGTMVASAAQEGMLRLIRPD